jgi:small subunit ribosomal protein S29
MVCWQREARHGVPTNFDQGQDLTQGHTSYQPDESGKLYAQPQYAANLLNTIVKANEKVLSTMQISMKHDLPMPVQSNISLARFAELGARDPEVAHQIYVALMKELSAPSKPDAGEGQYRAPLLLGFDAIDHAMRLSKYLDANTNPIHAHDLAIVNTFARYMTGENPLPNGGMVLAAVSESNRAASATMDFLLDTKHGVKTNWVEPRFNPHTGWKAEPMPKWNPYAPFDERVGKCLESAEAHKVEGLSKSEAKGLMEYYAMSGVLRSTITERLVSEKWSVSGGGIIGELERATVRMRI